MTESNIISSGRRTEERTYILCIEPEYVLSVELVITEYVGLILQNFHSDLGGVSHYFYFTLIETYMS